MNATDDRCGAGNSELISGSLEKEGADSGVDFGKHQAVGKLTFMYRDLVNEAISLEKKPSMETIKKWRRVGKIASDWQESCFVNCLLTSELFDGDMANITLQKSDELPANHPMSATLNNRNDLNQSIK